MKKYIFLLILILVILILAGVDYAYFLYPAPTPKNNNVNKIACTMEAKLCPDGTAVGRSGPNCEFAECPSVQKSGISGIALLGPMCPVERIPPDPNCADRPYKTELFATSPDGLQLYQQFSSDENGKFSVDLVPGEYAIGSANTANMFSHCSSQGAIKVEKGKYTETTVHCDTGIR